MGALRSLVFAFFNLVGSKAVIELSNGTSVSPEVDELATGVSRSGGGGGGGGGGDAGENIDALGVSGVNGVDGDSLVPISTL